MRLLVRFKSQSCLLRPTPQTPRDSSFTRIS